MSISSTNLGASKSCEAIDVSLDEFKADPWKQNLQHHAYHNSALNIRPAPEMATGEVVVASLYRAVGFPDHSEGKVPNAATAFAHASRKDVGANHLGGEAWRTVLHSALTSPRRPKQPETSYPQLSPVVPDTALYSNAARLRGNPWNPGELVKRMIQLGSRDLEAAEKLWGDLFCALSVGADDDVWARWLQGEFEHRRTAGVEWRMAPLGPGVSLPEEDKAQGRIPAVRFVRDLTSIMTAKPCMTRRQWVSFLEALLRIAIVAHVLWLCGVNQRLWEAVKVALVEGTTLTEDEVRARVLDGEGPALVHGAPALARVRDLASQYLAARLGLNFVLLQLKADGVEVQSLSSAADIAGFLSSVGESREALNGAAVLVSVATLRDEHSRTLNCDRGIGKNIEEFCRHVLGQRQAVDPLLQGYDQGFAVRKRSDAKNSPWVVGLGPVSVLALVHCCLADGNGPRSIGRFCEHLEWYGLLIERESIGKTSLGGTLRTLGLVLDSPDAENGMLLVPPFVVPPSSAAAP
jgi:hypothetical protein